MRIVSVVFSLLGFATFYHCTDPVDKAFAREFPLFDELRRIRKRGFSRSLQTLETMMTADINAIRDPIFTSDFMTAASDVLFLYQGLSFQYKEFVKKLASLRVLILERTGETEEDFAKFLRYAERLEAFKLEFMREFLLRPPMHGVLTASHDFHDRLVRDSSGELDFKAKVRRAHTLLYLQKLYIAAEPEFHRFRDRKRLRQRHALINKSVDPTFEKKYGLRP